LVSRERMPATSEPASGSLQQYDAKMNSSVIHDRYFFFCSSVPAMSSGSAARWLHMIEVAMPAQP